MTWIVKSLFDQKIRALVGASELRGGNEVTLVGFNLLL